MNNIKNDRNRTIALAGVFLAADLVQRAARDGAVPQSELATCVHALLATDADSVEAVYGDLTALKPGLKVLVRQMGKPQDPELTRYAVAMLHHARVLSKQKRLMDAVRQGLDAAVRRTDHFEPTHENIIAGLAETYSQTISNIRPRIMVRGDETQLQRAEVAATVRTLLLAGIRSAILWQQCGGSRLGLLFQRRRMLREAWRLLGRQGV